MSRIAFFILLALAIYIVWRLLQKKHLPPPGRDSSVARLPMVSCAKCGLHIPREEALIKDERYFCCEEHRQAVPPSRE